MKWTVYSKEKPQKVGSYLVTHTTDSGSNYVDYDFWTVADKFKYHPTDVVAWMPFPKPYEAEQTEPQYDEAEDVARQIDKDINVRSKDEPQTNGYQTFNGTSVYVSRLEDESQIDKGIGCSRCEGRFDCYDRDMPHAVRCNNYGKVTDEPQTEREGE